MPGKKMRSIKKPDEYEALRKKGMTKQSAARISNADAKRRQGSKKNRR